MLLEGNSKGSAIRHLTHLPTSRSPDGCTCWECSKEIFKANDKLNEIVFDKLRRKKMRHGEFMIDYPTFREIAQNGLTQEHWDEVRLQAYMQLDEMIDKDSDVRKPNFKKKINKKASNTAKIVNGYNKVLATLPAATIVSSLPYEADGVETFDRPLGKAAEKQILKLLNESYKGRRLSTQGELDALAKMMRDAPPRPSPAVAAAAAASKKKKSKAHMDDDGARLLIPASGADQDGRRRSSRNAVAPVQGYAESPNSDDSASEFT